MELVTPFWFKQRQCKAEPAGSENVLKVTGPNLGEAYLRIEPSGSLWRAAIRLKPDGEDVQVSPVEFTDPRKAWDAAFEMYREQCII
jgi:hypothetical protein